MAKRSQIRSDDVANAVSGVDAGGPVPDTSAGAGANVSGEASTMIASVAHAVKTYGGVNVVDDVSFELFAGKTTVLVGPNGSGKTTLMEMLVGLRSMGAGQARILEKPVVPGGEHRYYTGVQLQSSGLPSGLKVKEAIRAAWCLYAKPGDWRAMAAALGVDAFLDASVDNLSGGQRRRLDILCAAIGEPALLVLDEPTSGIDPEGRALVWDFVRSLSERGTAVLASTHDMAEAEAFADRLLVMSQGKIRLEGTVNEIFAGLGGEYRIRIPNPSEKVIQTLSRTGLRYVQASTAAVAVGDAAGVEAAAAAIKELGESVDVLTGPVRLEDVFAILTGLKVDATGNRSGSRAEVAPAAARPTRAEQQQAAPVSQTETGDGASEEAATEGEQK